MNEVDSNGRSSLMHAVISGNAETVKMLLSTGANIDIQDKHGYTALFHAASYGYIDISKLLIESRADINRKTKDGDTALIVASSYCNTEIIKLLLDQGADVNAQNSLNNTAVHNFIFCKGPEASYAMTKMLMDKGADLTIKDSYGYLPPNYALDYKLIDTAVLIRTKYLESWNTESASFDDVLRSPSRIQPEKGAYLVPPGKDKAYNNAVIDCNAMIIPYKKGLLFVTGPVGYGLGLAYDQLTLSGKFQKCMEKMGFQCVKDCSK